MLEMLDGSRLSNMPKLHETLNMPSPERLVQMHFLRENGEWFAVEYDPEQRLFYGYIDVRPGAPNWGYFGLDEIMDAGFLLSAQKLNWISIGSLREPKRYPAF